MENELYGEAHLADVRRMAIAIDTDGWKNPVAMPPYRVAVARTLIALASRIVPTAITFCGNRPRDGARLSSP